MILDLGKVDMLANPSSSSKGDSRYIYGSRWISIVIEGYRKRLPQASKGL